MRHFSICTLLNILIPFGLDAGHSDFTGAFEAIVDGALMIHLFVTPIAALIISFLFEAQVPHYFRRLGMNLIIMLLVPPLSLGLLPQQLGDGFTLLLPYPIGISVAWFMNRIYINVLNKKEKKRPVSTDINSL